jgi:hypothetical protein
VNQQELNYGLGGVIGQGSGKVAGANSGAVFTVPNQVAEADDVPQKEAEKKQLTGS